MGDFTTWPLGASGTATGAAAMTTGALAAVLTIRTLPSASVISNSETLDSETRSIRVLSLRRSIFSPVCASKMHQTFHNNVKFGRNIHEGPTLGRYATPFKRANTPLLTTHG